MSDPDDEATPSLHATANVPQMLQTRLIEESHVRAGLVQVSSALESQRTKLHGMEKKGISLPGPFRKLGKKEESPELIAAREEERRLARITRRVEEIARRLNDEIEALADVVVAERVPDYPVFRDARKKLQPWEQALTQFQGKVGKLVELLGQTRNMASSGYDKKRKALSGTAKGLLEKSIDSAKSVAKSADVANEAAKNLGGGLPEVIFPFRSDAIAALERLDVAPMQTEFDRIIAALESVQTTEIDNLKATGVGEADVKREQAATYLADYVRQLREHTDKTHFKEAQVTPVIQRLEARYLPPR
ncbi:MAG TPA: hypothetical protein VHD32_15910 [Candidatus Didemnitutus sp.]|nr:hypothetical protein [Candidatus Didemnitutus sp.]